MKQKIFTLLMMLALMVVAGSAFGQAGTKFNPYPGGTYSYGIAIDIANQSDAVITATGLTNGTSVPGNFSPSLTDIAITVNAITFDVTYSNTATGTCTISLVITDEVTGCSNNIHRDVVMAPLPTLTLGITATTLLCQDLVDSPLSGVAASVPTVAEPLLNTITFTVKPIIANITGYSYGYTLNIPTAITNIPTYAISYAGPGTPAKNSGNYVISGITTPADGVYTITWTTTTGVDSETLTGTIAAGVTMTDTSNGGTYLATITPNPATSTIQSVPGITGNFY